MSLISLPPIGLIAPIVTTWEDVHVCEVGVYPDKFGQIHAHQLIMWSAAFKNDKYIPILLEHQPFTWAFFGYVYGMRCRGNSLYADFALTRYGLQALRDYRDRHMGSGWSIGIAEGKTHICEITLCRRPRVSSTHVISLENISFDGLKSENMGVRNINGESSDIGDKLVACVRSIVDCTATEDMVRLEDVMKELRKILSENNITMPDELSEENPNEV